MPQISDFYRITETLIDSLKAHPHCAWIGLGATNPSDRERQFAAEKLLGNQGGPRDELCHRSIASHTIAKPGFNRWMVPPAALCIHLCIGQAYAFSVFNLPMTKLIGITAIGAGRLEAHRPGLDLQHRHLRARRLRGGLRPLGRGRRAAPGRCSPRRCAWSSGFLVSALGVYIHNLWLIYFGYGVIGGFGLGIGYISPVSTLINGSPTGRAWPPAWRSWASAAAPSSPRRCRSG